MQAVVPAAGEGTRLRPLTADTPKGLLEVAGEPLLSHCFDRLAELRVDRIVVVIGYRGQQIVDRYGDEYDDVPLQYVTQDERLGLAHALAQAEPRIDDGFVVYNGDNVFGSPPNRALRVHDRPGIDGTILVEEATRETARETGVVTTDEDGVVTGLVEKPDDPPSTLITTGVYTLPPSIFEACRKITPSDRGEYELADAIDRFCERGGTVAAVEFDGWRVNVNTPEDLAEATRMLEG